MLVVDHRLYLANDVPVQFRQSPNFQRKLQPRYVVLHGTMSEDAASTVEFLCKPGAGASYHVVVDRNGGIIQLVPFDGIAWHAGRSAWDGFRDLNRYSIGIGLVNWVQLRRQAGGWTSLLGRQTLPDDQVVEAAHKDHGGEVNGWQKYTPVQIHAVQKIVSALFRTYELKEILGHDDVSPGWKVDPGPAFPLRDLRSLILGGEAGAKPVEERTKGIRPYRVFYSYAHEDERFKDKLIEHLRILERRGYIEGWDDRKIKVGERWAEEISQKLDMADLIILLVSSSFVDSDYIWDIELKRAMERHDRGEAIVVPILVRPCHFAGAPFAKLQMYPTDGNAVSKWRNRDEAFFEIATAISDLVIKRDSM